jgi:hypothetical protein
VNSLVAPVDALELIPEFAELPELAELPEFPEFAFAEAAELSEPEAPVEPDVPDAPGEEDEVPAFEPMLPDPSCPVTCTSLPMRVRTAFRFPVSLYELPDLSVSV